MLGVLVIFFWSNGRLYLKAPEVLYHLVPLLFKLSSSAMATINQHPPQEAMGSALHPNLNQM